MKKTLQVVVMNKSSFIDGFNIQESIRQFIDNIATAKLISLTDVVLKTCDGPWMENQLRALSSAYGYSYKTYSLDPWLGNDAAEIALNDMIIDGHEEKDKQCIIYMDHGESILAHERVIKKLISAKYSVTIFFVDEEGIIDETPKIVDYNYNIFDGVMIVL